MQENDFFGYQHGKVFKILDYAEKQEKKVLAQAY